MKVDHKKAAEESISVLNILLIIFAVTYFIWYIGGGPERWEAKFRGLNKEYIKDNLIKKDILYLGK